MNWAYACQIAQVNPGLAQYTVHGIKHGFHPGIRRSADPISAPNNHPIPVNIEHQIYEDILHGLDSGFILGPFAPGSKIGKKTIVSPLGTAAKKNTTKIRVIQDLSNGKKIFKSVNSFISPEFTKIQYTSNVQIAQMVLSLGVGAHIWVVDMAEAYRRVLLAPEFHKFLGFKWDNLIFQYACLPFGLSSSPKIYSLFAECLRQIIIFSNGDLFCPDKLVSLLNYLDDFCGGHNDPAQAQAQFEIFKQWLHYLGVPTQDRKCISPSIEAIILGFLYNTVTQTIAIPQDKIKIMLKAIENILKNRRFISRREIAQLVGRLNWSSIVIFGGRAMLRSLEQLITLPIPWDTKGIRIPAPVIEDLNWWKLVLKSKFNSLPLSFMVKHPSDADIHIWSDAAGAEALGFGAFSSLNQFYQCKWSDMKLPKDWIQSRIIRSELLALVTAAALWGPDFTGKSVTFHCDNLAVVSFVTKKSTPADRPDLLHLIRWLTLIALKFRFYFWIEWIPGKKNIEADNLSRFAPAPLNRIYKKTEIDEYLEPFFSSNPIKMEEMNESFTLKQYQAHNTAQQCLSAITREFLIPDK